jgi:hypothetical protein
MPKFEFIRYICGSYFVIYNNIRNLNIFHYFKISLQLILLNEMYIYIYIYMFWWQYSIPATF